MAAPTRSYLQTDEEKQREEAAPPQCTVEPLPSGHITLPKGERHAAGLRCVAANREKTRREESTPDLRRLEVTAPAER